MSVLTGPFSCRLKSTIFFPVQFQFLFKYFPFQFSNITWIRKGLSPPEGPVTPKRFR